VQVHPRPSTSTRRNDYFGNQVHSFEILEPHRRLVITATSKVDLREPPPMAVDETAAWETLRDWVRRDVRGEGLDAYQFAFDSPRVARSAELAEYAARSFVPGRCVAEAALELNGRIHADFAYDPQATTVHTPLSEAFRLRRGVCQDLAHVGIGCIRSLGLPVRYVSGYVRTRPPSGKPRLVGADASHAWFSVYCGAGGWLDLDPTNNLVPAMEHITVAWGRDYSDVVPVRGMLIGGGQHTVSVGVDVEPIG
jgi:transglutaminase-like putative cysteine protease